MRQDKTESARCKECGDIVSRPPGSESVCRRGHRIPATGSKPQ